MGQGTREHSKVKRLNKVGFAIYVAISPFHFLRHGCLLRWSLIASAASSTSPGLAWRLQLMSLRIVSFWVGNLYWT